MAVHPDPALPVHPLSVDDLEAMVAAGILGEDDRVQLLDGVLVAMSPLGAPHARAIRELMAIAFPVVAAAGLQLSVRSPLALPDRRSLPEPDVAVVRDPPQGQYASAPLLVLETGATSLAMDLGPKANAYARAGVPDYWVLDVVGRRAVVHRSPVHGRYTNIVEFGDGQTVEAERVALAVPVANVLPPR